MDGGDMGTGDVIDLRKAMPWFGMDIGNCCRNNIIFKICSDGMLICLISDKKISNHYVFILSPILNRLWNKNSL